MSSPAFGWDAPWKYAREPSSPWNSAGRKENREGFFAGLGAKFDRSEESAQPEVAPRPQRVPLPEIEDETSERIDSNKDLASIPWRAHRTIYPSERFSPKLEWPVSGGRVTSGYGIRGGRFHEGLDVAAPEGTSIHAAASGRVVFSGTLGGYGRTIVVYHGDGMTSVYAHNSGNVKERGDMIRKGDVIAFVGHTGHASGSHCHFEIRKDGKPLNPLRFSFSKNPLLAKR